MTTADVKPAAAPVPRPPVTFKAAMRKAGERALGGGVAGALAMVVQVLALMWLRTTINYQHSKGLSTLEALKTLYADGGIVRFYRGMGYALLQAPLSRFGDTASNAGVLALLESVAWLNPGTKTLVASCCAALFRILISPIDTLKTTLQVQGSAGMAVLSKRIAQEGVTTLYSGALGSSAATLMGHYPWFVTHNFLDARVPPATGKKKQLRTALIGLASSFNSDVVSNSMRVVKTAKQTSEVAITYAGTVQKIIAEGGIYALLFRGLGTKILSNGVQAMLFTICWKYLEAIIAAYIVRKRAIEKKE
eukprot:CAMPEP_0183382576 /NCGR_PEP_ID=MMETSP0164_2-20130417/127014_1 /TAXON_ID=221442 /ORGANISM="Coccolithus pelagicus ssp braarudi, Strain PLY182g" /LENGTH=305 /DNA_ID=CAMNT_0025560199 /DNA_START=29 /DNA_END=946 /DNA_ORIENTATION=+